MASGIITLASTRDVLEGRIVWNSSSNGSSANTSNTNAELQIRRNDGYTTTGTWNGNLNLGGKSEDFSYYGSIGSGWVTVKTLSNVVGHNDNGTGSCWIYGKCNGPSGTSMSGYYVEGSQTVTLDTIPRKSSVTCADGNIGSSTTININRQSNSFTHTITYSFGNLSGTIATKTNSTSIGWTIPTSFYAQIPNATNGKGTITCETFNGNTSIGTSTCTFNAFVINSNPTVSATVVDTNATTTALTGDTNATTTALTGDSNKLVKYFSNAKVTITATAKNSATIKSQKVVCGDGKSATTATSTLNKVESGKFTVSTTDSRGLSGSATVEKTMVNYIKLALTEVILARPSTTSNTVNATIKGNYFNASFGKVANTLELKWRYRLSGGTWNSYNVVTPTISGNTFSYSASLGSNYDYGQGYEFEIVATDKLISDTNNKMVTQGKPIVDIGKKDIIINGDLLANLFNGFKLNSASTKGIKTLSATGDAGWSNQTDGDASLITKAFIAFWNGRYNSGSSNLTYCYQGEIQAKPKTLYDNASGTTGTVTLSETSANFNYLEIYFALWGSISNGNCVKISAPNGKQASLETISMDAPTGTNPAYINNGKIVKISGTSITNVSYLRNYMYKNDAKPSFDTKNEIYIYKVIGYK